MATPELRFVDEDDNAYPDWEEKKLGDVAQIYQPETLAKGNLVDGNIPVYGANGIIGKTNKYNHTTSQVVVTCRGATCGVVNYTKPVSWINGNAMVLNIDENHEINKGYFYQVITNISFDKIISGSAQPQITRAPLNKIRLCVPAIPEQQKIANLFSLIDGKIENLGEQVSLWKQYKQGLSQKLFTQQLRFVDEDGNTYPDWEEKKLGEMITKNIEKNREERYTYVESISNRLGFVSQQDYFDNHRIASKKTNNYTIIRNNCFAYNPSRINVGSIGLKADEKISIVSPLYVSFYCKSALLSNFLLGWFATNIFKNQMRVRLQGSVRDTLDFGSLSEITLSVPSLLEQQKIANLLSMVDEKIENLEDQESKWKLHKQALMQKMFI